MEAEKEESEDEEMEDDGADVSRRASTRVVWILMVVNSLSENPPPIYRIFIPEYSATNLNHRTIALANAMGSTGCFGHDLFIFNLVDDCMFTATVLWERLGTPSFHVLL